MPDWIETFVQEAEELLAEVEQRALLLTAEKDNQEAIHSLFRLFHTIKGSSGMCGLDSIAGFTHHVETLLDKVRAGAVRTSSELVDVVLAARDHIAALIAAESGADPAPQAAGEQLIAKLKALAEENGAAESPAVVAAGSPAPEASSQPEAGGNKEKEWHIQFRPGPDLLTCGGNPILLFRDLQKLGPCRVVANTEQVPPLEAIAPERCYLWWDISLRTRHDENAIRDVFLFVEDGSELRLNRSRNGARGPPETATADSQRPGQHCGRGTKRQAQFRSRRCQSARKARDCNHQGAGETSHRAGSLRTSGPFGQPGRANWS